MHMGVAVPSPADQASQAFSLSAVLLQPHSQRLCWCEVGSWGGIGSRHRLGPSQSRLCAKVRAQAQFFIKISTLS